MSNCSLRCKNVAAFLVKLFFVKSFNPWTHFMFLSNAFPSCKYVATFFLTLNVFLAYVCHVFLPKLFRPGPCYRYAAGWVLPLPGSREVQLLHFPLKAIHGAGLGRRWSPGTHIPSTAGSSSAAVSAVAVCHASL